MIDATKEHYLKLFIDKLENTFAFSEEDEMEDYFRNAFYKMLDFTEDDVNIIRVAMGEVRDNPEKKLLISQITEPILSKLEEFFKLQIDKGILRDINPKAIALVCYSIMFQSIVLWQVYGEDGEFRTYYTNEDFLDILYNGIKP